MTLKEEILKYLDDVIVSLRTAQNSQEWLTRTGHLIGKIHAETTPDPFLGDPQELERFQLQVRGAMEEMDGRKYPNVTNAAGGEFNSAIDQYKKCLTRHTRIPDEDNKKEMTT